MASLKCSIFLNFSLTVVTFTVLHLLLRDGALLIHANSENQKVINIGVVDRKIVTGFGTELETGSRTVLGTKRSVRIHEKEGYNLSIICFQSPGTDTATGIEHHLNCMKHISLRRKLVPHELKSLPMLISGVRKQFGSVNVNVHIRSDETEGELNPGEGMMAQKIKNFENFEQKTKNLLTGTNKAPGGSHLTKNSAETQTLAPATKVGATTTTRPTMFKALHRHFMRKRYEIKFR